MSKRITGNHMLKEENHDIQIFHLVFLWIWTMIWMNNWCRQVSLLNSKQIYRKTLIKYAGKLLRKSKAIRYNHFQRKIKINFKVSNGCLKKKKSLNKKSTKESLLEISQNSKRNKLRSSKNHNRKSKLKDKVQRFKKNT